MSFNYINKLVIILLTYFLFSCQDIFKHNDIIDNNIYNKTSIETKETLDLSFYYNEDSNILDYYTNQLIKYDFTKKKLHRVKIKSYLDNINELIPLNLIYDDKNLYSLNAKGNILKINKNTGEIIKEIILKLDNANYLDPISFSYVNDHFIIGFKSGEIIKTTKKGVILWKFKKDNFLNTPIKVRDDFIIVLYPEDIILISNEDGNVIFEQNYSNGDIIQSNGAKFTSYFNFLYFILPNSSFGSIDTFFFEENQSEIDNLQIQNSLNNLNDNLHIYKNFLVYLDNGNRLTTFDIIKDKFLLKNFILNNVESYIFYNNSLVLLKNNLIEFYNIKNGKLFFSINIDNKLKKDSNIIKITNINDKLHIFFKSGKLLILDNKQFQQMIDLKIKDVNNIYFLKNKLFISNRKGITYIY
tara:strand:+ start:561 stop:1799 length:1239 start_codon:yes stop_codon:yes gene_type:complete